MTKLRSLRTPRRAAAVALAVALALVPAACGSSGGKALSPADYKKKIEPIGRQFVQDAQSAQSQLQTASTKDAKVAALEKIKQAFDSFGNKIAALKPPSNAQGEQDKVVSVSHQAASDAGDAEGVIKSGDKAKGQTLGAKLRQDGQDFKTALSALQAKLK